MFGGLQVLSCSLLPSSVITDDQEKRTNQFIIMDSNFRKVDLIKTA